MPSRGLPANLSGLLSKSSYVKSAVSKKAGREDKYGKRSRRIVSLVEAFADAKVLHVNSKSREMTNANHGRCS
jgi:hypothetical protein